MLSNVLLSLLGLRSLAINRERSCHVTCKCTTVNNLLDLTLSEMDCGVDHGSMPCLLLSIRSLGARSTKAEL